MGDGQVLRVEDCVLVVTDIQEAFVGHIDEMERVIERSAVMIEAARLLGLAVVVTEQYPKGLGRTVEGLQEVLGEQDYLEKVTFNALGEPTIRAALESGGWKQAVLVGIETHICVAQTARGLLAAGYEVQVAADAVSSRRVVDREVGLARLRQAGVVVTTTEATIMEMTVSSKHERFREISRVIK